MYTCWEEKNLRNRGEGKYRQEKENFFLFIVFSAICYLILHNLPLAVDDFGFQQLAFHSPGEALHYVLSYGNGRLLGNGGIIFLTHHLLIGDLLRAMLLSGIAVLLPVVLQIRNRSLAFLSMILILTVSPAIFGQTYSWLSGFQNYVPPIFLSLCGLRCLEKGGCCLSNSARICFSILGFLCALTMQLYIEHSSCINLCLAVFVMAAVWKRKEWKTYRLPASLFLAGAVLGTVLMGAVTLLSNPNIIEGTIGHTSYLFSGLAGLFYGIVRNGVLLLTMFSENAISLILLSALQTIQIMKNRALFSKREQFLYPLSMLLPAAVFLFQLLTGLHPWYGKLAVYESAWIILAWIFYIAAYVVSRKKLMTDTGKNENLPIADILSGFTVIAIIPLLLIWPIGYRCLLHSGIALIGAVLLLADETLMELKPERERLIRVTVASVLAAVVICESMVFMDIRRMVSIRDASVEEQVRLGSDSAAIFLIPSPYIYEVWNEETEHYRTVDGHQVRLKILPADVWFRMYYYHYT